MHIVTLISNYAMLLIFSSHYMMEQVRSRKSTKPVNQPAPVLAAEDPNAVIMTSPLVCECSLALS